MDIPLVIKNKISNYCNIDKIQSCIVQTKNINNVQNNLNNEKKLDLVFNFGKVNDIRRINKFHEEVNRLLEIDDIYISCAETIEQRKLRKKKKIFFGFKNIYLFIDFFYKRVIPKLPIFKKVYFLVTKGYNRVLSKSEVLGRVISCGFNIIEIFEYNHLLYVISKKISSPKYDMAPSYGPIFRMKRIGYKGKIIGVFKFRTMHPYSEYCQELIYNENKLSDSGKFNNDYRVTNWGRIFRKFWIDEIPMIINLLRGELSIIGVRPLSKEYFSKYPEDLQKLRIQIKPGLIPPYYADLPNNFDEILLSEEKYIIQKLKNPLKTDIKYFCQAFYNIIFKGARSH